MEESKHVFKLKVDHKSKADKVTTPYLYSDVDETLVCWPKRPLKSRKTAVKVKFLGTTYYLIPHLKNIETLKQAKANGNKIVVWSAGGDKWATEVIKALKLTHIPDYILSKPTSIIDDLKDANEYVKGNLWKEL